MNQIIPDGVTKEFQLSVIAGQVPQILIYDNGKYNEAKYIFNEYKNTVVFDEAPAKDTMVMISFKSMNGGLEPK